MKLLVDMNLSPIWAEFLTAAGIEAVHWSKIGPPNAADAEIMAVARRQDFVVLTHDLDFSSILAATGGTKPSVIQLRTNDVRPSIIGQSVTTAIRQMKRELEAGALLTIDPARARLRLLPLHLG